jgi:hypothetical protein
MTVYLHIGSPKCGSSTIQALLSANRRHLEAAGIALPKDEQFAHDLGHQFVRGWLNRDTFDTAGSDKALPWNATDTDLILSSETYLAIGAQPESLDRFLAPFGDQEIHVLAVMRSPAALLESTWFQWMRTYRTFEKVREVASRFGYFYKDYLGNGWFERIDASWARWRSHSAIASFVPVYMDKGERIDFTAELNRFVNRKVIVYPATRVQNESMNGVTFRLLLEFRGTHFHDYRTFVRFLDREMRAHGFRHYRYLADRARLAIHEHCAPLRLFSRFAGTVSSFDNAADIPDAVFDELLEVAHGVAASFIRPASRSSA